MLQAIPLILTSLIVFSTVQAGQVTMSCDFNGLKGIDDIQIKKTSTGLKVDVYLTNEKFNFYTLPLDASSPDSIDLSSFNVFNDSYDPRLAKLRGQWYFQADRYSLPISCATLK